jgi:hypothetical protein
MCHQYFLYLNIETEIVKKKLADSSDYWHKVASNASY